MNEDKIGLEEAINFLIEVKEKHMIKIGNMKISEAIERVLQELEKLKHDNYKLDKENQKLFEININSIPKKKIEDKINKLDLEIDEEYEKSMAYHQLVYARCELKELLEDK